MTPLAKYQPVYRPFWILFRKEPERYKVGPLPGLNGIITHKNRVINGYNWGYKPFKWRYNLLTAGFRGPPCRW